MGPLAAVYPDGQSARYRIPPGKAKGKDMTTYSLEVQNNSSNLVTFCMFQTPPDLGLVNVETLAWFVEAAYPTTRVVFDWDVSYSFVWDETGPLSPGVTFDASQVWPADPSSASQQAVQFLKAEGAYTFKRLPQASQRHPGSLYIEEGPDVPLREASVGIGMSGAGTFAVEAQPNQHLVFTPHPEYWLVAGDFQTGEVLDMAELSDALKIEFYGAQMSKKVSYTMDNTFVPVQ